MRNALVTVVLAMSMAAASTLAVAQVERRPVQFAQGASSATLKGTLEGDRTVDHVLRARAGQTMSVNLVSRHGALYFNVLPPGSETALHVGSTDGNLWRGRLPADGEYRVRTYLMRSAARRGESAAYTLTIGIDGAAASAPAAAPRADARVAGTRFHATGKLACTLGSDPPGECDFGVVRGAAGHAEVHVRPPGGFERVLRFSGASVTSNGSVKAEKRGDDWQVEVDGFERYRIPEAVVTGG